MENKSDGNWKTRRRSNYNTKGNPDAFTDARNSVPNAGISAEPITAWRVWRLVEWTTKCPILLESVTWPKIWQPMKPVTGIVGLSLYTGIHAWKSQDKCLEYMAELSETYQLVYGEVSLWGRVLIHTYGYKAEQAYPKTIYVPKNILSHKIEISKELRNAYGVETLDV